MKCMKYLFLALLITGNCFGQEKTSPRISVGAVVSGCKNSEDLICKGIVGTKKEVETQIKRNMPAQFVGPTITLLAFVSDQGIKIKKPILENDQVIIQQKKVTYQINFEF